MRALRECGLAETSQERNGKSNSGVKPHHFAPSWSDNKRLESILGASVPMDLLRLYPSPKSIDASSDFTQNPRAGVAPAEVQRLFTAHYFAKQLDCVVKCAWLQ